MQGMRGGNGRNTGASGILRAGKRQKEGWFFTVEEKAARARGEGGDLEKKHFGRNNDKKKKTFDQTKPGQTEGNCGPLGPLWEQDVWGTSCTFGGGGTRKAASRHWQSKSGKRVAKKVYI